MAITGAHMLLYTDQPDELRATLRDVFGWDNVDAGGGWLIFKMPPSEMGIHPAEGPSHEISFLCDDINATVAELAAKGIASDGEIVDQGFGLTTFIQLPGVKVLLYEPRHLTAI